MKTLELIQDRRMQVPMSVSWYLSDIGHAQGLQELFTRQSPQKLKVLREHAIAQSAISSNRIEGVEIDQARIGTVVFGHPALKDREEEEVAGYRNALELIHTQGAALPVSEETILHLHKLSRGNVWDAGRYKDKPVDIIEKLPGGGERVRFRSVSPAETPEFTRRLVSLWRDQSRDHDISPLIVLAAFNLDFLCIHPFRDGNGRVSRLLLLLTAYHLGIEVGRYISLERIIEDNKARYYETLQESSQGWHEGKHNPWPYIGYLLYNLKLAYNEFTKRAGHLKSPRGAKTELVMAAISGLPDRFTLVDVERVCPGVSRDMVRKILKDMQKQQTITCSGRGPGATWEKR
ncbi:MAG: Fic family protein [Verrucomicrobia bacterium]|nr:Fic family protein [Verrucomicrobiota bacterium]MBU1734503.1 Fic family protein [Verrucomicrobiota bacterium]MBU1855372.1 Fic family protein [Verrucomicrobiota bacterium]